MEFSNEGGLFNKRIAKNRTENLSWSFDGNLDVSFGGADYIAQVTAGTITNTDGAIAGTFNQSGSLKAKFAEDGQSDGFNDHATRYNTSVSKSIEIVDTYGGVPSCLLFGSMVSKSDGSVVNVEDLNIGDEILTYLYKVLLMKVQVIGKMIHLINQVVLLNTHQVFKELCMSFSTLLRYK